MKRPHADARPKKVAPRHELAVAGRHARVRANALRGCGDRLRARRVDERTNPEAQIRLADIERRNESHDLVVETAGDEQHVALERSRDPGLRALRTVEPD